MIPVALISNSGSGSADETNLAELLGGLGAEVESFEIERAERAGSSGAERIVVAGGDGSIAVAAEAAIAAGVPLAVIPAGTANDFADRMGLPADLEAAARIAVEGSRTREVDLARVGRRGFVNVASLGLAPAAADLADDLKADLGALAYTVGALRAGVEADPVECRVECDGELLFEGGSWQVTVGCSGAFGGGSRIEADADDGRLDVVVIEEGPRLRLAKHAIGLRRGKVEAQRGVRSSRCARVEISTAEGAELNVDGELIADSELCERDDDRLHFRIDDQRFRLVAG